ncbi:MAG: hypothetical protein ABII18_02930 [bacterium]
MNTNNKPKVVYTITEMKDGKSRWSNIGAAFLNKDGSINVILNSVPVDGKLHIRDREFKK